ncbi:MAG TPA: hypothetical protein V6C81_10990 [Planktothrix sp.]|jgi:hypothetical protein
MTSSRRYTLLAVALVAFGSLQMIGDLTHVAALKAIGMAWGISPAPKVFTAQHGYETYSTQFFVDWQTKSGAARSLEITPALYSRVRGPYNRRNVIGAALSYGPVLYSDAKMGRPMFNDVVNYSVCGSAPLLKEIGIDSSDIKLGTLKIRYVPAPGAFMDASLPREIGVTCQ